MKRLLWITPPDCFGEDTDPNAHQYHEMNNIMNAGEFFFELPDGPLLPEGTVVELLHQEMTIELCVRYIYYWPKYDKYWFLVDVQLLDGGTIKEFADYLDQNWIAEGL